MPIAAIIVAAGRGSRAGDGLPKQYRTIRGRMVLTRTLDAFGTAAEIDAIVVAIHPDDADLYQTAVDEASQQVGGKLLAPAFGGATRQSSVRAGLAALDLARFDKVLVHDAARPFVTGALISAACAALDGRDAAIPGVGVVDTIKRIDPDGLVVETPPRDALRAVQTPQSFRLAALRSAHEQALAARREDFTDDGALVEWAGMPVMVFPGDPANIKLTHEKDFSERERNEAIGAPVMSDNLVTRVGTGFDVHAFGPGDHVMLGGVAISHDRGVVAHSDGDVVLHALTDAILGALADGDIGTHFPPSDPQWRGASSDRFLAYAVEKVRTRGGMIDLLDVTVLAEEPRIGRHREAIRERIAEIAGISVEDVSIKATTTEKLGFTGRREGVAAQAAATIRLPRRS
ncbi:MAG: bifunctional 2-C-methyl-D-erythritol 4-phosphate cytidylyltransferase/2-C-methyl-D-erythritol 2,4-cyclodiphosphate synthase [Salinarimonadaceae bacterium]|nr:MAG: bifunctional 2-C-methyl-D-erythritol 4-phosphate cytidylyltransferase/2-C-methyl-D-erythritol 2,4-cyclodiphosphate synthase [Salinarimonadaceae bacterium]